ncbi:MAG: hypothetical protein IPP63_09675 [Chloracidobacterium sp.]|nr:hypothetical protein [Chloracidobacterium sp.]
MGFELNDFLYFQSRRLWATVRTTAFASTRDPGVHAFMNHILSNFSKVGTKNNTCECCAVARAQGMRQRFGLPFDLYRSKRISAVVTLVTYAV